MNLLDLPTSPRLEARVAGLLYVLVIVLGGFFLPVRGLALLYLAIGVAVVYIALGRRHGPTPLNQSVVLLLGEAPVTVIV